MNQILCSIRDSKAEYWSYPRSFRSRGDALRSFDDAINSGEGYGKHPEDFGLFAVGEFDESTGFILHYEAPVVIEIGINLIKNIGEDHS